MIDFNIVKMTECHIKHLSEIEKQCFSTPWSENALREELTNANARFFVAAIGDDIAGYIGAHNILGEVYITNVAVNSAYRRKGVGKALVQYLCSYSEAENGDFITLEVRKSNEAAKKLYENQGFGVVGERKSFYENPREDAVLMTKFLKD